jgi:hypothetical protein
VGIDQVLAYGAFVIILERLGKLVLLSVEWNHQDKFVGMTLEYLLVVVNCFVLQCKYSASYKLGSLFSYLLK